PSPVTCSLSPAPVPPNFWLLLFPSPLLFCSPLSTGHCSQAIAAHESPRTAKHCDRTAAYNRLLQHRIKASDPWISSEPRFHDLLRRMNLPP
ncbi:MAG: hypothetical protein ABSG54_19320, partial [Terriglobia bacterium]